MDTEGEEVVYKAKKEAPWAKDLGLHVEGETTKDGGGHHLEVPHETR